MCKKESSPPFSRYDHSEIPKNRFDYALNLEEFMVIFHDADLPQLLLKKSYGHVIVQPPKGTSTITFAEVLPKSNKTAK